MSTTHVRAKPGGIESKLGMAYFCNKSHQFLTKGNLLGQLKKQIGEAFMVLTQKFSLHRGIIWETLTQVLGFERGGGKGEKREIF